jgi:hypothetical protein
MIWYFIIVNPYLTFTGDAESLNSNHTMGETYRLADIMQTCPKFQERTLMREIAEKLEFLQENCFGNEIS